MGISLTGYTFRSELKNLKKVMLYNQFGFRHVLPKGQYYYKTLCAATYSIDFMKHLTLLLLLALFVTACDQKKVDANQKPLVNPTQKPLQGTYEVTHLKQYQGDTLLFDGKLPAVLWDTLTIKHKLSIELSITKSSPTDAFIGCFMAQSWGDGVSSRGDRTYGRPISNDPVKIVATQSPNLFSFSSNSKPIGVSNGQSLSFDFVVVDSTGRPMRYVYEATKISDRPNKY